MIRLLTITAILIAGTFYALPHLGSVDGRTGNNCSSGQGGFTDYPSPGEFTKVFYYECNGVGVAGYAVYWWAIYNFGANQCYLTMVGGSCVGQVLSIQLATNSTGYASVTISPSQPSGSWSITGVPGSCSGCTQGGIPTTPQNLVSTGQNTQIVLTWQAPTSNGGSTITSYKIYRGTSSGGETPYQTLSSVLTYSDSAVTSGTTYYYKVSAVSAIGESSLSNESSASTIGQLPPSSPQNLQATSQANLISLTWNAPSNNGGATITNYKIYRGVTSGSESLYQTLGNVNSYADYGVTTESTYYYKVSAVNSAGEGPLSNEASATVPTTQTVPSAPQNLQVAANSTGIILNWQSPSNNGGSQILNYRIYRGTTSGRETLYQIVGNILTYQDSGTTTGTRYYYQVSVVNSVGESALSNEISAVMNNSVPSPPSAPQNLQSAAGDKVVTLTWNPPSSNGGAIITEYRIYRGLSETSLSAYLTLGNVNSYSDFNVTDGVTYYYTVTALNSAGQSPESNTQSATPMAPPTGLEMLPIVVSSSILTLFAKRIRKR